MSSMSSIPKMVRMCCDGALRVSFLEREAEREKRGRRRTSTGLAIVAEHETNWTCRFPTAAQIRLSLCEEAIRRKRISLSFTDWREEG